MARISAKELHSYLVDNLAGEKFLDQWGDKVLAVLDPRDGIVYATEPDAYPERVLARFRVTVEEIQDGG